MDKVRIAEIAKELGMKNKDIIDKAMGIGLDVKGHASAISTEDAEKLINYILSGENAQASKPILPPKAPETKKPEIIEPAPVVEKPKVSEVVATPKTKTLKEKELESGHREQIQEPVAADAPMETVSEGEGRDNGRQIRSDQCS